MLMSHKHHFHPTARLAESECYDSDGEELLLPLFLPSTFMHWHCMLAHIWDPGPGRDKACSVQT